MLVQGPIVILYPSMVPADHKNMEFASTFLISSSLLTMTISHTHQTLSNHLESYFRTFVGCSMRNRTNKTLTLFWSGEAFSEIISMSQKVVIRDKSVQRITNEIDINWFWLRKWQKREMTMKEGWRILKVCYILYHVLTVLVLFQFISYKLYVTVSRYLVMKDQTTEENVELWNWNIPEWSW